VLDADIAGGHGRASFPQGASEKFIQFGIAEQNMMRGRRFGGGRLWLPRGHRFRRLLSRAFEQARLSIGYCKRNVKIVASHPGLDVGPDGVRRKRSKTSPPSARSRA